METNMGFNSLILHKAFCTSNTRIEMHIQAYNNAAFKNKT